MKAAIQTEQFDPEILQQLGRIDLIVSIIVDGVRQGLHRTRRRGFSTEFSDFKLYVPGDDLRLLDWRIYARTDRLFVKCFEAETSLELMLVLDATASMAWRWEQRISKLEYATNLLAALACIHMKQQDQVGLLVHDARELHHLPPRCRRTQLNAIFALLEEVEPGHANTFALLVDSLSTVKRHRGLVIACSDLEEDESTIEASLKTLAGAEDEVILFHLLDQAEIELPFAQITHLRDSETGATIPVRLEDLKREHEAGLAQFRDHWREQCEKCGVLYVPIHTGMDYVDAIHTMLEARTD